MQKLIFPQEIEVWFILPAIRKELAAKLVESGMSQKEVAKLMHLTEAAVSQYKSEKRANENFINSDIKKEISKSVKKIISNPKNLHKEMVRLNNAIKSSGILCKLHKKKSSLEKGQLPCINCEYNN